MLRDMIKQSHLLTCHSELHNGLFYRSSPHPFKVEFFSPHLSNGLPPPTIPSQESLISIPVKERPGISLRAVAVYLIQCPLWFVLGVALEWAPSLSGLVFSWGPEKINNLFKELSHEQTEWSTHPATLLIGSREWRTLDAA